MAAPRVPCANAQLRLARKNPKVGNSVEHIEIAKHRREHRVDQREAFAVKTMARRNARFKPRKSALEL